MRDDTIVRLDTEAELPAEIAEESAEVTIPRSLTGVVTATLPAVALAACGGGSSGGGAPTGVAPTPAPPPVVVVPPTKAQASRFLAQSTMGATSAEIDKVVASGYEAWISEQFALPRFRPLRRPLADGFADLDGQIREFMDEPAAMQRGG